MIFHSSPHRERAMSLFQSTPSTPTMTATTTQPLPPHAEDSMEAELFLRSNLPPVPASAMSLSSGSHNSPAMSTDAISNHDAPITNNSSLVPSPEPLRGRELEAFGITHFQLPDAMIAHNMSSSSLYHYPPSVSTQQSSAMQEAVKQNSSLIRRLSSRASSAISRRRASSARPNSNSRDVSVGPGILRRRSDSTNTSPPSDILEGTSLATDLNAASAASTTHREGDSTAPSTVGKNFSTDSFSTTNGTSSIDESTGPSPLRGGPAIPLALLHGTPIRKVTKKNTTKMLVLTLDLKGGKILWDKSRPNKCIYIDDIKEVRTAEDIRQYRLDFRMPEKDEPRFFSILYTVQETTQTKLMHLIANTDENFQDWISALDAIYRHRQDTVASLMAFEDDALRSYWEREIPPMVNGAKEVDLAGLTNVCHILHIHMPTNVLKSKFAEADVFGTGRLDFAGFQHFLHLIRKREDVHAIYRTIASNTELGITLDEFLNFLRTAQGENVDEDVSSWESIFNRFSQPPRCMAGFAEPINGDSEDSLRRMTEHDLSTFLSSSHNQPIIKEPKSYVFDRPVNEYFISSSHNTYLVGRQVAGTSSVEGYITALTRGCRCVEIDCWDGADGQPIVVHGNTWTSSISFRAAIDAINKYAFAKSQFPLWISLEVHCCPEQQKIMAKIMREVLGTKLVTEPLRADEDRLPSPSELMGRILIKTKKTEKPTTRPAQPTSGEIVASAEAVRGRRRGNSLPNPFQRPTIIDNGIQAVHSPTRQFLPISASTVSSPAASPSFTNTRKFSVPKARVVNTITEGEVHLGVSSSSGSESESGEDKSALKQSKIVHELGSLAVYCVGVHKSTPFDKADCKLYNHILSWDESVFEKYTKTREFRRAVSWHNMRYLMRVYPKPYRIGSSNFNPLIHWRKGVQMAALNWQTYDLGMQLNTAMFTGGSDQSGYVLKPEGCRGFQVLPNLPGESKPREFKRERKNVTFSIGVISAQRLMRPLSMPNRRGMEPFVEVEVFMADDKRERNQSKEEVEQPPRTPLMYRTKSISGNGFNPIYDQKFNFSFTTKYPDLVFVRFTVKVAENTRYSTATPMATYTAKLSNLKQGYRNIPLLDVNADRYLFSTLFCEIRKDPIVSVYMPTAEGETNIVTPNANTTTSKLRSIRTVFNRSNNISPKSSFDSGLS